MEFNANDQFDDIGRREICALNLNMLHTFRTIQILYGKLK